MKIILAGGSGQIGTILARAFLADRHEVVVLSRKPTVPLGRCVLWDAQSSGPWRSEIEGADVVVNLVGKSVNCRYTARNRRIIRESRIRSTEILGKAIAEAPCPPRVWLQASTATIYSHRYDAPNTESAGILGGEELDAPDTWKFSIAVAKSWEDAASRVIVPQTRKVLLRSAMTMSPDRSGVFDALLGLVRCRLGGASGNGKQYISWIHDQDFVRALYWLIDHEIEGPVNLAAPHPIPDEEFMRTLRAAWGTRFGLPAPQWLLEIGTFFLRTESELVLKSRRVIPERLLQSGFSFEFPTWKEAAANLCARWRAQRGGASAPNEGLASLIS